MKGDYGLRFFHAAADALNPLDLFWGILRAFRFIFGACGGSRGGGPDRFLRSIDAAKRSNEGQNFAQA